jgi:curved DNA-binding protein CbpA
MSQAGDFYKILGVPRDAPEREIKRAYYKLARDLHPDKAQDEGEARKNSDLLAAISQAYNTLKDPRKRAEYDASRGYAKTPSNGVSQGQPGESPSTGEPAPPPVPPTGSRGMPGGASSMPRQGGTIAAGSGNGPGSGGKITQGDMIAQRKIMAQKAFVRGMQFFKRQELREALPLFEAAVTNDPESEPQYHLKYAQCLMRTKGSYGKAAEHARLACEMDQYNIEFKLMLGEIHEMAGVTTKAVEVYEDVLRWDPTNPVAKAKLAIHSKGGRGSSLLAGSQNALGRLFPSLFNKK